MLGAMRAFCKRQPACAVLAHFVLGGREYARLNVAATVAQLNAEALSALAYTQVVNEEAVRRSTATTCRPCR